MTQLQNVGTINTPNPTSAFGDLSVSNATPIIQIQYPYNLNTSLVITRDNTGTSSVVSNLAQVSTSAAANASAMILSRRPLKYNPGEGGLHKFTGIFDTAVANNTQEIGIGDVNDGYSFGYNGTAFGVLVRRGGSQEVRVFTVTAASTTSENIELTLDGTSTGAAVTVTVQTNDAEGRTVTANEIAAHDYSGVGPGWAVHSMGPKVFFHAYDASSRTGTYEITTATTATATVAQSLAGAAPTDTYITQANWNADVMDGTGPSEMVLDQTKGNVYKIQYQWLGFGPIDFFVENPATKSFQLVHRVEYGNANIVSSVTNPTLPMYLLSKNAANTTDIVVKVGSHSGEAEGMIVDLGVPKSTSVNSITVGTTEIPLFTIHSHDIYQGLTNRVEVMLRSISASTVGGTKAAIFRIVRGATVTGAAFSSIDSNTSTVHLDTTATVMTGGKEIFAFDLPKDGSDFIKLKGLNLDMVAPEFLTMSGQTLTANTTVSTTLNWTEAF